MLNEDVLAGINARVAGRIEAARIRRVKRNDFQRHHLRRRAYGKAKLHTAKLARSQNGGQT